MPRTPHARLADAGTLSANGGFVRLSRDELERELGEIESALTKARTNLELARVDLSRWALLLDRADALVASIEAIDPDEPEATADALADALAERDEILTMQRVAHLRFAGCTASIEALVRVEHTVRNRLSRAVEGPRTSGVLRRVDVDDTRSGSSAA